MSKFQVGDKVQQSETSGYRYGTPSNPINTTGTIVEVRDPGKLFEYRVEWPNNHLNSYEESDLVLVEAKVDVLESAKQLFELRIKQAELTKEIEELAEKVRKALEGTGLQLIEEAKEVVEPETLLSMVLSDSVKLGQQFLCNVSDHPGEHVVGKVYEVIALDRGDSMPIKLTSEDSYGWWLDERFLQNYTLVS